MTTTTARPGYRVSEAAEALGIHRDTLYKWIRSGQIKAKEIGRTRKTLFITAAELERFINDAPDHQPNRV